MTPKREAEIRHHMIADYDYGDAEMLSGEGQELFAEIYRLRESQATAHERYERLLDGNDRLQRENREFMARIKKLEEALWIYANPENSIEFVSLPAIDSLVDRHATQPVTDVAEQPK